MSTSSPESGVRRLWPAALIFAISLAVYLRTLCPTVFVEGTGENIICAWTLGVPHPPGFPLFCILAKIFGLLMPVGSVAYRINLFAAVMGGVAAGGLYLLLTAIGIGRLASAAAALAFAFSATFWGESVIAEVYTLSLTIIIIQIGLLLRWRRGLAEGVVPEPAPATQPAATAETIKGKRKRRRDFEREQERRRAEQERARLRAERARRWRIEPHDRLLLWFALAFGLGLTVHYNHILLLPAYLYFILANDRGVFTRWRLLGRALLLVAAGFSLHLYAPIRSFANPAIDWGNPETLSNWWNYLTAAQYRGRMFHLPIVSVLRNLGEFLADLPVEFWWLGLLAVVGGAVVVFRRDRTLFWMTALIFLVVALWSINYNIPWEIKVYYLQALLVMAIWIGFGLHWAVDWLARRGALRWLAVLVFAVPALALVFNFSDNDLSDQCFVLDNGLDILQTVDDASAIILPSTNPTFVLLYLTRIEGKKPRMEMWSRGDQGVKPVAKAVYPAEEIPPTPEPQFIVESLDKGLPVYAVDRVGKTELSGFAQVPWGCLYRLGSVEREHEWLEESPAGLWGSYRFQVDRQKFKYGSEQRLIACRYLLTQADHVWDKGDRAFADGLYSRALKLGREVPQVPLQVGQRYADQERFGRAVEVYQRALAERDDALLHNRLGAIYGRQGDLSKAEQQFQRAIELKPEFGEAHANLASVYGRRRQIDKAIEELELAIKYEPNNLRALKNLAAAYAERKRTADAIGMLRKAMEVNPADQEVRKALARLVQQP